MRTGDGQRETLLRKHMRENIQDDIQAGARFPLNIRFCLARHERSQQRVANLARLSRLLHLELRFCERSQSVVEAWKLSSERSRRLGDYITTTSVLQKGQHENETPSKAVEHPPCQTTRGFRFKSTSRGCFRCGFHFLVTSS